MQSQLSVASLPTDRSQIRSTLQVFIGGLGDHILAVPAVRALCRILGRQIHLLSGLTAPDLFFADAGLKTWTAWPMQFKDRQQPMFDAGEIAGKLGPHDLYLGPFESNAPECERLRTLLQPRWWLDAHRSPAANRHTMDEYFDTPRAFCPELRLEDFAHPFPLPDLCVEFVHQLRKAFPGKRLLVVHGETKPYKMWSETRLKTVLDRFLRNHPNYVAIRLAKGSTNSEIPGVIQLSALPFATAMAVVAGADLALCVDSVFLHVADLWRVPAVGLFGATDPRLWGFRLNPHGRCVTSADMESLSADEVLTALEEVAADTSGILAGRLEGGAPSAVLRWS